MEEANNPWPKPGREVQYSDAVVNIASVAFVVMVLSLVVGVLVMIWGAFDDPAAGGSGPVTRSEPGWSVENCEALRMMILDNENSDAVDDAITYEEHC